MSLFDILEGRMREIFEGGGAMAPLPFKKLAKNAVTEMRRNAIKMDGQAFAPSLYTILVSPADDAAIAPLYQQVTDELVDFIAHEAQNRGLALMANPMVRFISDDNVKQGRPEVVAEVVTPDVLESLRKEEAAYAQHRGAMRNPRGRAPMQQRGGAGQAPTQGQRQGQGRPQAMPQGQQPTDLPAGAVGRSRRPAPTPADGAQVDPALAAAGTRGRRPATSPLAQGQDAPQAQAQAQQAPRQRQAPAQQRVRPANAAGAPNGPATCELVDVKTGRTWRIGVASTVIGRDESSADLVLNDTNVSRRHAELKHLGGVWVIADLGSTNGTRVNGLRVSEEELADGDTVTLGLVNLLFREL